MLIFKKKNIKMLFKFKLYINLWYTNLYKILFYKKKWEVLC